MAVVFDSLIAFVTFSVFIVLANVSALALLLLSQRDRFYSDCGQFGVNRLKVWSKSELGDRFWSDTGECCAS